MSELAVSGITEGAGGAEPAPGRATTGDDRVIVVLDTCVLLADPNAIEAFPGCDIVLPLTVIEELDGHKTRLDDIGRTARMVTRRLEQLRLLAGGDLRNVVPVGDDSTLRIELNGLRIDELERLGLPSSKSDNRILAAALGLSRGHEVRLVSADTNMRIKAAALGLKAQDWAEHVAVSDHSDPGWKSVEIEESDTIDELHRDHRSFIPSACEDVPVNSFVVLRHDQQSVLTRRIDDELVNVPTNHQAWGLRPRAKEQSFALDLLMDPTVEVVALSGPAGTGKTIVTLAAALQQTFEKSDQRYDRIMVIRPVIAIGHQDIGYLPGTKEEKLGNWFEAVVDTMVALGDKVTHEVARRNLDVWADAGRLVYEPITYLRGRSLQSTFIIVDEAQNLEASSLKTILTRVGDGSKIVFLGDVSQIDNVYVSAHTNAISVLIDRFRDMPLFGHVRFTRGERSAVASAAAEVL